MRTFFLYYMLASILGNPFLALMALAVIALVVDRRFIGLLPDITKPLRRNARLRQLRATVELAPFDARSQLDLGMLLFEAGRAHAALPHLEKAASKLTDHATALYTLGAARVATGSYAAGATALREAIALRPEVQYGMPYVYLAMAALQARDEKRSESEPGGSLVASEAEVGNWVDTVARYGNAETCYRMGAVLRKSGKHQAANRMFREAVASYQQSPGFARRASRCWALLAKWQLAKTGKE